MTDEQRSLRSIACKARSVLKRAGIRRSSFHRIAGWDDGYHVTVDYRREVHVEWNTYEGNLFDPDDWAANLARCALALESAGMSARKHPHLGCLLVTRGAAQ